MRKDLTNNLGVVQTLAPITWSGNTPTDTGLTTVDGENCASVEHVVNVGASGDTLSGSVKVALILQHSTDDSTWAAVTDAGHYLRSSDMETLASGIVKNVDAPADASTYYRVTYVGPYRYSRIYLDFTGNHASGIVIGAIAIKKWRNVGSLAPTA